MSVDIVNDKMVVNDSRDGHCQKQEEWLDTVRDLKNDRTYYEGDWATIDNRKGVTESGEIEVYFMSNDPTTQLNKPLHGTSEQPCLI